MVHFLKGFDKSSGTVRLQQKCEKLASRLGEDLNSIFNDFTINSFSFKD